MLQVGGREEWLLAFPLWSLQKREAFLEEHKVGDLGLREVED